MATRRFTVLPWAGWLAGPAGWVIQQQTGSSTIFWDCSTGKASFVLALGAVGALVALAGGALSWVAVRKAGPAESSAPGRGSQRFIGLLGMATVAIFLVAIAGGTMAGLMLPGCGP